MEFQESLDLVCGVRASAVSVAACAVWLPAEYLDDAPQLTFADRRVEDLADLSQGELQHEIMMPARASWRLLRRVLDVAVGPGDDRLARHWPDVHDARRMTFP